MLVERWHYQGLTDERPGRNWQATPERFIDPETGRLVTVFFNPATGERRYVADAEHHLFLVAHGMGVALVPRSLADSGLTGALFKPIGKSTILSESWCVWRGANSESKLVSALVETIRAMQGRPAVPRRR